MSADPKYVYASTFKDHVRHKRSTLSPGARHVALTIADRRTKLKPSAPVAIKRADIVTETGICESSVTAHLTELVAGGWIVTKPIYVDGKRTGTYYWLADPTDETGNYPAPTRRRRPMTQADRARLADRPTAEPTAEGRGFENSQPAAAGNPESGVGVAGVVRSNYLGGAGDPPGSAGTATPQVQEPADDVGSAPDAATPEGASPVAAVDTEDPHGVPDWWTDWRAAFRERDRRYLDAETATKSASDESRMVPA